MEGRQGSDLISFGGRTLVMAKDPFKDKESENTNSSSKVFRALLGNITSFGPKIENYVFRPGINKNFHLFGLLEAHKASDQLANLKSKFAGYGRSCFLNPAVKTGRSETGTHGGEMVSARNDIDFVSFQEHLLQQIVNESGSTLHFTGGIVRFRNFSVAFVFLYLQCSVGMNDENNLRMEQVHMLLKILGLPWIIYSDFNMLPDDLLKSGWPQFLKSEIVTPKGATSTLKGTSGRIIDFCLVHRSILGVVKILELNSVAPSTPHFMLNLELMAHPRFIVEPTICVPNALPLGVFSSNWAAYDDTVEVHNPASLLVDLTPLTPTLNIGKPGTHRNEKLKHNLCRLLPNIKCGGYGGERHRKTMQDLVLQQ